MRPAGRLYNILLCVATCLCSGLLCSANEITDYRRPIQVHITCCTAVSSAKIKFPITEYKIQSPAAKCVYAVIFRTEKDGSFCTDPNAAWVRRKVTKMSNGKVQLKGGRKRGKGGKGEKRGKKRKDRNKEKRKTKQIKATVTPSWFPSTAAATAPTLI